MGERFIVWGGEFENTEAACAASPDRRSIIGQVEEHGPFDSEAEAERVWLGRMRRNVDVASYRLIVERLPG